MSNKNIKLSDKTVLASFSVSRWGGYCFDRRVTSEVHRQNEVASDAGNYNKRLLPKGASAKIDAVVSASRIYHRGATLPWLDAGVRILPAINYESYAKRMREFREQFEEEQADFFKNYPKLVKESKTLMGKMFDENDYPTLPELKSTYKWDLTILPFPDTQDFRVTGAEGLDLDAIRSEMEGKLREVWKAAQQETGQRIVEVVARMSERLKGYKPGKPKDGKKKGTRAEGTFKDSLVDNVRELVEILPSFNLTNDPKLTKIIGIMQKELCVNDADVLRDDAKLRQKVAKSADDVLTAISDFMA